uniref:Fibroblast growth factor n=1 Tax=Oryzias sinensis TaxID=183150 RepID=A0A8C8DHK6_9TELE
SLWRVPAGVAGRSRAASIRSGRRTCRLYCRVGIGFHLQIHPDGRVNGSHEPNHLSVLQLVAISQGVIGIKGVYSNRFLAMNKRGWLHATVSIAHVFSWILRLTLLQDWVA